MKWFFSTLAITVVLLFSFKANATEHGYDFRWQSIPVICGTPDEVNRYIENEKFEIVSMSVGRENAQPNGAPAYIVTYYISKDGTESISAVTSPSGTETCMLYRSFDLMSSKTAT